MNYKLKRGLEQFVPFLILGIAIALVIGIFVMISYVVVWGIIVGLVLWVIVLIKNYFSSRTQPPQKQSHRVINHDKH